MVSSGERRYGSRRGDRQRPAAEPAQEQAPAGDGFSEERRKVKELAQELGMNVEDRRSASREVPGKTRVGVFLYNETLAAMKVAMAQLGQKQSGIVDIAVREYLEREGIRVDPPLSHEYQAQERRAVDLGQVQAQIAAAHRDSGSAG